MNAQHGHQWIRRTGPFALWIMRFDQSNQDLSGRDLIHLDQEALAAGLLTFAGVLGIGEGHLFHRDSTVVFVSDGYFTRFGSLLQSLLKSSVAITTTSVASNVIEFDKSNCRISVVFYLV